MLINIYFKHDNVVKTNFFSILLKINCKKYKYIQNVYQNVECYYFIRTMPTSKSIKIIL